MRDVSAGDDSHVVGDPTGDAKISVSSQQAKIERNAYIWNTVGGLIMAFQSVIMLIILMRVCDVYVAGVFTIAYANANLFLSIGKYGMRNFQVSDVRRSFTFGDYAVSRAVTSIAMIVGGLAYLAWSALSFDYSIEKSLIIAFMCLFKVVDAIEDVFFGNYQQNGRLDVAGRLMSVRLASTLVLFGCGVAVTHDLLIPLIASTLYSALFFVGAVLYARRRYGLPIGNRVWKGDAVLRLLKECSPLFLAAFLLFYIGNAPKYAIDACLGDAEQAYYGFISMPVFVVGLLASFVYAPIIAPVSKMWEEGDKRGFIRTFAWQVFIVVVITIICDIAALIAGVPVLSVMYNTNLAPYLAELVILVAGGGFLALASLFTLGLTILREQKKLIWGYAGISLLALVASPWIVQSYGVTGASWEYFALMVALSLWFGVLFIAAASRSELQGFDVD